MSPINEAAWIPSKGAAIQVGLAEMPVPGPGEVVIENHAIPLHPGDWKLAKGIIPIPITYPATLGNYATGVIYSIGPSVTRFQPGDRIISMPGVALRNDHRFGGHQKYVLSTERLSAHIPQDVSFEKAATASIIYGVASALFLHISLERPVLPLNPNPEKGVRKEKVLIWGGGSQMGFFAVQIAALAGYNVITTASRRSEQHLLSLGASAVIPYSSPSALSSLISHGPYTAVFAASDDASSQVVLGDVLAAQGGGSFLSTMGVREGVVLPEGVKGVFRQYMDDYFSEGDREKEFTGWVWGDGGLVESLMGSGRLGETKEILGLEGLKGGLDRLEKGEGGGRRLVVLWGDGV